MFSGRKFSIHLGNTKKHDCWIIWQEYVSFCKKRPNCLPKWLCHFAFSPAMFPMFICHLYVFLVRCLFGFFVNFLKIRFASFCIVFFTFFNWSMVNLHCCVSFRCTVKWLLCTHTFLVRFFSILGYFKIPSIVPCTIQ